MSEELFRRVASIQVDTLLVRDLRIAFKVQKKGSADPNTATVSIYNLSAETRARLSKLDRAAMVLTAGYAGTEALIFAGDLRKPNGIQHTRAGADWVTKLECGDGERAYREARFTGSYAKGTKVVDVARDMAKSLGVGLGNLEDALAGGNFRQGLAEFPSGFSAHGNSATALTRLLRGLGLEASIQDGQLQVLREAETLKGYVPLLSNENSTIIGSPEYNSAEKDKGPPTLKVRTPIQPVLKIGGRVRVESAQVSGFFKIKALAISGDTHGGDWNMDLSLLAV